jgi:hypothetical protein
MRYSPQLGQYRLKLHRVCELREHSGVPVGCVTDICVIRIAGESSCGFEEMFNTKL